MRRLLLLTCALAGCRGATDKCAEAAGARDHAAVREVCPPALDADPRVAVPLAHAHVHFGDYDAALALLERAQGTPAEATLRRVAGKIHERRGDVEASRADYRRALDLHRAADEPGEAARDAQALAGTYWKAGAYAEALPWLEVAETGALAAGDGRLRGFVLLARGSVLMQAGDGRGAEAVWRSAEEALGDAAPGDRAWIHAKIGYLRLAEGRPALARSSLEQAEALAKAEPRPDLLKAIHLNKAVAAIEEGRLDLAGPALDAADAVQDQAPDASFRVNLLFRKAELAWRQGRTDDARRLLAEGRKLAPAPELAWRLGLLEGRLADDRAAAEAGFLRAIDAIETLRRDLDEDDLRAWFLAAKREPYAALFALRAASGDVPGALAVQERALARMFLDAFVERASAAAVGEHDAALRALLPAAAAAMRPVDDVLASLGDAYALVWFPAEDKLWLTVVEGGRARIVALPAAPAEVEKAALRLAGDPDDEASAAALGALLLPPDVRPPRGATVHVVPAGPLLRVPFAAVRVDGRPLVADHTLVHVPGLTALSVLRRAPASPGTGAVVLGDARGDLPQAYREATAVAARLGVSAFVGAAANAEKVRGAADAAVLHVATHAGVGAAGAWLGLADGPFDARRILESRIRPRLVVLASCASGASPGDEMWGSVASAFLAAGARHVVAALWSVDDTDARRFVEVFYEEGGAQDPVGAVARAQRKLAAAGPTRVWAPFFVTGG